MISNTIPVHVFWRGDERVAFTYAGRARAVDVVDKRPVLVTWAFEDDAPRRLSPASPSLDPIWRRGPEPSTGARVTTPSDGPTDLYLLRLTGPVEPVMPSVQPGQAVIKVGRSNDVDRRLAQLNAGMPPGGILRWEIVSTRTLPDAARAHMLESSLLEKLRLEKAWIGGEFAIVAEDALVTLLDQAGPEPAI